MKPLSLLSNSPPRFASPKPVGQLYFPDWDRYEAAMRGIFDRTYYNNNGPLLTELEEKLRALFGVKHAICVGNATFGLMMVADALELKERVLMPSFTFISSAQSLAWCGLEPVFCDVDPITHQMDPDAAARHLQADPDISAIMAVNLWGGVAQIEQLQTLANAHDIPLYFDSAHAFGCEALGQPVGGFGAAEVFSFHATKVLSAAEGGCVTTNCDELAARLRGIRPSYDKAASTEPYRVLNSRMSEAQAAIALLNLEDFEAIVERNGQLMKIYRSKLGDTSGLRLVSPSGVSKSNNQYAVCEVDAAQFGLTREQLVKALHAENVLARLYFHPATHRCAGFDQNADTVAKDLPVTEHLCDRCMQLPLGAKTSPQDIEQICDLILQIQAQSTEIATKLEGQDACA